MWPTLINETGRGAARQPDGKRGANLTNVVTGNWPTVQANDDKSGTGWNPEDMQHTPQLRHLIGGLLSPRWCEMLQGWPLNSSGLQPEALGRWEETRKARLRSICGSRRERAKVSKEEDKA